MPRRWFAPLMAACLALAACAGYQAAPLSERAGLANGVAALRGGATLGPTLTLADLTRLVLLNNPDLRAVRARRGVAAAQMLQAGLPPNPFLVGSVQPLVAGPGSTTAYNSGVTYDFKSLLTLPVRRRAAAAARRQVDAQTLWEEWQVAGQARLLAVDVVQGGKLVALLRRATDILKRRRRDSERALAAGNTTLATAAPDIAAYQVAQAQRQDAERLLLAKRHQLCALMNLEPDAPLRLDDADLPPPDPDAVRAALPGMARRRPDLVALRYGYAAEDQRLRAAILAQFPNLSFGVTGGSDNSNARNIGPQIAFELPAFDRNQGNIAIEHATRAQLRHEYAARLAAAHGQVLAMLGESALTRAQLATLRAGLPEAERATRRAQAAMASADLDERSAVDLILALVTRQQAIVAAEQSLLEQLVALDTLTGAGLPSLPDATDGAAS